MDQESKERIAEIMDEFDEADEERDELIDAYFESDESCSGDYIDLAVLEDFFDEIAYIRDSVKKEIFYCLYDENISRIISKYEEEYKQGLGEKIFGEIIEELKDTDDETQKNIEILNARLHHLDGLCERVENDIDTLSEKLFPSEGE